MALAICENFSPAFAARGNLLAFNDKFAPFNTLESAIHSIANCVIPVPKFSTPLKAASLLSALIGFHPPNPMIGLSGSSLVVEVPSGAIPIASPR